MNIRKEIEKKWEIAKLRLVECGAVGCVDSVLNAYRNLSIARIYASKEDAPNPYGIRSGSRFEKEGKEFIAICATKRKIYLIDKAISGEYIAQGYMNDTFFSLFKPICP